VTGILIQLGFVLAKCKDSDSLIETVGDSEHGGWGRQSSLSGGVRKMGVDMLDRGEAFVFGWHAPIMTKAGARRQGE
jgi:hypothetical protein